ncbi:MAG: hypothetical protein ACPHID_02390 [Thermoplasmatota archaeon]
MTSRLITSIAIFALLAYPVTAQNPDHVSADLMAQGVQATGAAELRGDLLFLGVDQGTSDQAMPSFSATGVGATIRYHHFEYNYYTGAAIRDDPTPMYEARQWMTSEVIHGPFELQSTDATITTWLHAKPVAGATSQAATKSVEARATFDDNIAFPSEFQEFALQEPPERDDATGISPIYQATVDNLDWDLTTPNTVVMDGQTLLVVADLTSILRTANGERIIKAGTEYEPIVQGADGTELFAGRAHTVQAHIEFHDAQVSIHPGEREWTLRTAEADLENTGTLVFADASGDITNGASTTAARGEDVRFSSARMAGTLTPDAGRIAATVKGSSDDVTIDGVTLQSTPVVEPPASIQRWNLLAWLILLIPLGFAAKTIRQRRRWMQDLDILVMAAADAYGRGQAKRSRRWSKAAIRKDDADEDAWTIWAMASLARGKEDDALQALAARAQRGPHDALVRFAHGILLAQVGAVVSAEQELQHAQRLDYQVERRFEDLGLGPPPGWDRLPGNIAYT